MSILKRKILEVKEAVLSCLQVVNQWQSGSKYVLCLVNSIAIRLTSSFFENRKHNIIVLFAVIKQYKQKQPEEERVYFNLHL